MNDHDFDFRFGKVHLRGKGWLGLVALAIVGGIAVFGHFPWN